MAKSWADTVPCAKFYEPQQQTDVTFAFMVVRSTGSTDIESLLIITVMLKQKTSLTEKPVKGMLLSQSSEQDSKLNDLTNSNVSSLSSGGWKTR